MINSRALVVAAFMLLLFGVIVARLFDIQVVKSEEYKYYAQRQQTSTEKIKAQRGMIYDRNNVMLAYNRNDVSFFVDVRMATKKDKEKIAQKFSEVFKKNKSTYLKQMDVTGKTICIEKKVPGDKALLLKGFKANGFFSREDPTRVYHYGNLASHILGYVGENYEGVTGIEKNSNAVLKGEDGIRVIEKSAIGDLITVSESETRPADPGMNVYLTINKSYQSFLEEGLKNGIKEFKASSATGIIMDPNTGEILALANAADYDPNFYWKFSDSLRRNRALTDTYEPGSTFKGISMAALLDQKLCRDDELIFVENGRYSFHRRLIKDSHEHQWLTVKGIFEQSSNIGMAKLIQRINDDQYYKYLRGFGFGNITAADLPGEVKGKLKKPSEWSNLTKVSTSFGYEISVTPLQLITAYSALINGGILYEPQLIRKISNVAKDKVIEKSPRVIRTVISNETSAKIRNYLAAAVENGTGKNAKVDFVTVGGKTGTSQQFIDGKYSKAHYNTSFIGFFPADEPKIICLILVNAPEIGRYGGLVAAPMFKKVAEKIYLSDPAKFRNKVIDTEAVSYQYKFADNQKDNSKIKKTAVHAADIKKGIMPDLLDHSMKDAIIILKKLGVKYKIDGSGKVVEQSIQPGTKLDKGLICRIFCSEISDKKLLAN